MSKPKNTPPPKTRCHGERSIKWRLLGPPVVVVTMTVAVVGGGGGGSSWLVNLSLRFGGSLVAAFVYLWVIARQLGKMKGEEEGGRGRRNREEGRGGRGNTLDKLMNTVSDIESLAPPHPTTTATTNRKTKVPHLRPSALLAYRGVSRCTHDMIGWHDRLIDPSIDQTIDR